MKRLTGLFAFFIIAVVGTATASAFGGNDDIRETRDNEDYEGWIEAHNARYQEMISEEGFEQALERHQNRGEDRGMDRMDDELRASLDEAIADNDYDTWLALHEENELPVIVEEKDFDTLVAMHEARDKGDMDLFEELREELGFPPRGEQGRGGHGGFATERCMQGDLAN